MDESEFELVAGACLEQLAWKIEESEAGARLEVEYQPGMLTIELRDGRSFVLNRHAPTQQIWLSSPISGAHYFLYNQEDGIWHEKGAGEALNAFLTRELAGM